MDDPLPWMLADTRRLQRNTRDGLWLRLVDVAATLSQRQYAAAGKLVIQVQDEVCPWNAKRFALEAGPEGASCRATEAAPELALTAAALASTYLGAVSFSTLGAGWAGGRAESRGAGAGQQNVRGTASPVDAPAGFSQSQAHYTAHCSLIYASTSAVTW